MKPLICEMCGSNDVVKQDGLFVCQICGTKYSVEEARKMMIEGPVDVSGSTVKIDNSASVKNFLLMAESAYRARNNAEAERYCNKVLEIEPYNSSAWFLKGKASGWQSTVANPRIEESVLCFSKTVSFAPDSEKANYSSQVVNEFNSLSTTLMSLCCNNFVKYPISSNSKTIANTTLYLQMQAIQMIKLCGVALPEFSGDMANLIDGAVANAWPGINKMYTGTDGHPTKHEFETYVAACSECISLLKAAIQLDHDNTARNIDRYQILINLTTEANTACSWKTERSSGGTYWEKDCQLSKEAKEHNIDRIMEYHGKIKELDPNYTIPKRPKAGGCYVATCVYGSYDCPEVWTLRRYRDEKLALTKFGRAFIHTYYAISPTIVKMFGNRRWFRAIWKRVLDNKVKKLHIKGYEDSPYKDKEW